MKKAKKFLAISALSLVVLTAVAFAAVKSNLVPVLHGGDPIPPCAPCTNGGHGNGNQAK